MCNLTKEEVSIGCKKAATINELNPKQPNLTLCEIRRKREDLETELELAHCNDSHLMEDL